MAHSWLANVRETKGVLEEFGLYTKHRLGQNFLVNDDVIGKILALAELGEDDVVFEVGPGIGTLTVAMLSQAGAVCSVEADRTLEAVLPHTCARDSERFALVMGDALRVGEASLVEAVEALGKAVALHIVHVAAGYHAHVIHADFRKEPPEGRPVPALFRRRQTACLSEGLCVRDLVAKHIIDEGTHRRRDCKIRTGSKRRKL